MRKHKLVMTRLAVAVLSVTLILPNIAYPMVVYADEVTTSTSEDDVKEEQNPGTGKDDSKAQDELIKESTTENTDTVKEEPKNENPQAEPEGREGGEIPDGTVGDDFEPEYETASGSDAEYDDDLSDMPSWLDEDGLALKEYYFANSKSLDFLNNFWLWFETHRNEESEEPENEEPLSSWQYASDIDDDYDNYCEMFYKEAPDEIKSSFKKWVKDNYQFSPFWLWYDENYDGMEGLSEWDEANKDLIDELYAEYTNARMPVMAMMMAPMMLGSSYGNLWPANYGEGSNIFTESHAGDEEDPYVIDSVEDLREFALQVTADSSKAAACYKIKNKSGGYDLGGGWIPVGFKVNGTDSEYRAFTGKIYAENNVQIKNLGFSAHGKIDAALATAIQEQEYLGFFGELGSGAVVTGLNINTSSNTLNAGASTAAGILAGHANGAIIKECSVQGAVKGLNYAGGLVGYAEDCVIEDAYAGRAKGAATGSPKLSVYTTENAALVTNGAVGGIAGRADSTVILDAYVATTDTQNIYGKNAYVGGVVGWLNQTDLFNTQVEQGKIGSSDTYSVGGLVGGYDGGNIKVARMSADIANPSSGSNYSAAFIGSRIGSAGFDYGEEGSIAFLYTDSAAKAQEGVCGARIADDGVFDYDAHIGYWHATDNGYSIVASSSYKDGDDYFYQELEYGINSVKSHHSSTTETLNHFSCNSNGRPVRGYLLAINNPTKEGNEVAVLTAYINGAYKNETTATELGAFPEGADVRVSLVQEPNTHYVLDSGRTNNPYYLYYKKDSYAVYDTSKTLEAALLSDGGYHLTMPASDITVSADFIYTADTLSLNPSKLILELTQYRTGKRENPDIAWKVTAKDSHGSVIKDAKEQSVDGKTISSLIPLNFYIGSDVNGSTNMNIGLAWTTNNAATNINGNARANSNVITNVTSETHSTYGRLGYININLSDSGISDKIAELETAQKNNGYRETMTTASPYNFNSLIKAQAVTDAGGTSITNGAIAYTDITVALSVVDTTNISLSSVEVEKPTITYNIVRTLSGNRKSPVESFTVNGGTDTEIRNSATFSPDYFSKKDVHWYLSDTTGITIPTDYAKINDGTIKVTADATDYHIANIALVGIGSTSATNSFVAEHINEDYNNYAALMYKIPDTLYTYTKGVKVTGEDKENSPITALCTVTVTFKTIDNTEIMPEGLEITGLTGSGFNLTSKAAIQGYDIVYNYSSGVNSNIATRKITLKDTAATVIANGAGGTVNSRLTPVYDPGTDTRYSPYNKEVIYSIINKGTTAFDVSSAIKIDPLTGAITVRGYSASTDISNDGCSPWIQSLLAQSKLKASQEFTIVVRSARDNSVVDSKDITLNFTANVNAKVAFDGNGANGGSTPTITIVDGASTKLPANGFTHAGSYTFSKWNTAPNGTGVSYYNESSISTLNDMTLYAQWSYTGSTGGSGGGGGGGGGSSSGGSSDGGPASVKAPTDMPSYVKTGTWSKLGNGKWTFMDKDRHVYTNEWAAVQNPYADTAAGQPAYDWYYFGADSAMVTGWFTDPKDGQTYWLSNVADGRQGWMYVGAMQLLDGIYYYFNEASTGTKGALMRNYVSADGKIRTNAAGQMLNADGSVKRK